MDMGEEHKNDEVGMKIATDENHLTDCGCGANNLKWSAPDDHNANEADHSLQEAREIGGEFVWEGWDKEDFDADMATSSSFEGMVQNEKEKAERNGVRAFCSDCYGTMSPTLKTQELMDKAGRR
jgi:hypothetical protein